MNYLVRAPWTCNVYMTVIFIHLSSINVYSAALDGVTEYHVAVFFVQVEEEYKSPGSQEREAVGKLPQMWGQSLYVLASLVKEVSGT